MLLCFLHLMLPGKLIAPSMAPLRALMLLWVLSRCLGSRLGSSEPAHDIDLQHLRLPEAVQGFKVSEIYSHNREEATAAYKDCMQHGSACHIPCSSISNCVGCHPAIRNNGKAANSVCAYCLPGYMLSADRTSCQACPIGHSSKVGGVRSLLGWKLCIGHGSNWQGQAVQLVEAFLSTISAYQAVNSSGQHALHTCTRTHMPRSV
jgi:hypothetical protein